MARTDWCNHNHIHGRRRRVQLDQASRTKPISQPVWLDAHLRTRLSCQLKLAVKDRRWMRHHYRHRYEGNSISARRAQTPICKTMAVLTKRDPLLYASLTPNLRRSSYNDRARAQSYRQHPRIVQRMPYRQRLGRSLSVCAPLCVRRQTLPIALRLPVKHSHHRQMPT